MVDVLMKVSTDDHDEEDDNAGVEKQRYDLREREKIKCPTCSWQDSGRVLNQGGGWCNIVTLIKNMY